jgi:ribosomal protein S18 acetylase RimI-like enzyme
MDIQLSDPLLRLRNITANDEEVLCQIYSSTRIEELAQLTNWPGNQKEVFLRSQFSAQHTYYQANYTGADFWMIEYRYEVIGRLYVHTNYQEVSIRIIDISLLPQWRNRGIGKQLLLDLLAFAERLNRPVTIHVENFNPAMRLYKSLGFELVSKTNGVYHLLEWHPAKNVLCKNTFHQNFITNGSSTTTFNRFRFPVAFE